MADFAFFYGVRPDKIDYGLYVGLKLNLARLRNYPVYTTMQGIKAALAKQLPDSLFDPIAPNEDAAADMALDANLELSRAEAVRTARGMMG